jgi:hypothetical protein
MAARLERLPALTRLIVVGAMIAGMIGCVVGLIVGLVTYAPTAWFAVLEIGMPAALVGATLGLLTGLIRLTVRQRCARRSKTVVIRPAGCDRTD